MSAFVEFKNVKKTYKTGEVEIHALNDVSFEIEKGEFCVIVGASGAGKTTILNILGGMDTLTSGSVKLDGAEISAYNKKQLTAYRRYDVGFVFQFYNLVGNLTALENVELAAQICREPLDAATVLDEVRLGDRMTNFPAQLSGGEQQRVAIARALMLSPDILCFDEPTSALDPELTGEVLKVIGSLKSSESTMVIVTHEMEFARKVSDKVIFMADGVIEEMGTPAEIFDDPKSAKLQNFLNKSQNLGIDDMESGFNAREWAKVAQDGEECLKDNELIRF
jgi:putative ABC transport system ATP-binding protein